MSSLAVSDDVIPRIFDDVATAENGESRVRSPPEFRPSERQGIVEGVGVVRGRCGHVAVSIRVDETLLVERADPIAQLVEQLINGKDLFVGPVGGQCRQLGQVHFLGSLDSSSSTAEKSAARSNSH